MRYIMIIIALLFYSTNLFAMEENELNEKYIEFAKTMGLYQMLDSSLKQTDQSMKKQMNEVLPNILQGLPNITDKQKESLDKIINNYLTSIIASIDIDTASNIYIEALIKGMSEEEVEFAFNFYKSEKGKKVQQTIGNAAQQFQTYMLMQIENANSKNYPIFMNELEIFMNSVNFENN